MKFCNWDWRPAVLADDWSAASAVLAPGESWSAVDAGDVATSAGVMSEADWRATFERKFGPLDLSKLPAQFSASLPAAAE